MNGPKSPDIDPRAAGPEGETATRPVEITALLGRGTQFEGKLNFDGRIRIEGRFHGDIQGEDVLVIGEGGLVAGSIEVRTCIVTGGEVHADIRARDAIELYAPAKVVGNLHAPAIFIDRGVQFEGNCKMQPLDDDPLDDAPTATSFEEARDPSPRPRAIASSSGASAPAAPLAGHGQEGSLSADGRLASAEPEAGAAERQAQMPDTHDEPDPA